MEGHGAVMPGPDSNTITIQDLRHIVRVNPVRGKRNDPTFMTGVWTKHVNSRDFFQAFDGISGQAVFVDSPLGGVSLTAAPRFVNPTAAVAEGSLLAPMPGSVIRIAVAVGDHTEAGQPLLWLEAMKMEHTVSAAVAGVVDELLVIVGQQVELAQVLVVVTAATEEGQE